MRALLLVILLLSQFESFAHGGHMATHTFTFSDTKVELEFKISVAVLSHYSQDLFGDDFKLKKGLILTNYINSKTDLIVDDTNVNFSLVSSHQNEGFLIVIVEAPVTVLRSSVIEISSSAFYEVDALFENRIVVSDANGNLSSYRLKKSKSKQVIQL